MCRQRVSVQTLFGGCSPATPVTPIVEQKDRQAQPVKGCEIVQSVNDVPRVPMTPEEHGGVRRIEGPDIPSEQLGAVRSLKPHIFQWKAGRAGPIMFEPGCRMIHEEPVEQTILSAKILSPKQPSFAKASEGTRFPFFHGLTAVASCEGG